MSKKLILVLGGARSGKSRFVQEMASQLGDEVLFVATSEALDEEMRLRIEKHRESRPPDWRTLEAPTGVGKRIEGALDKARVVILECLTLLVSNIISRCASGADPEQVDITIVEKELSVEIWDLVECIDSIDASFIIVSNEVGMGLVPANRLGRLYRDLLGKANQELAQRADAVYLLVSGIPLAVKTAENS